MSVWRVTYTSEQLNGGAAIERLVVAADANSAFAKIVALDSTATSPDIQLVGDNEVT